MNDKVKKFYQDKIFRQYKWYKYINKQKSETKLVNNIKKTFGENPVLIIGDWSEKQQIKHVQSTPGIGLKKRLVRDFEVYKIDEFRTSKLHWKTEEICQNMKKTYFNMVSIKLHSVLKVKLENGRYGCINRDRNSVRNIGKLVRNYIETGKRKEKYERKFRFSDSDKESHKDLKP